MESDVPNDGEFGRYTDKVEEKLTNDNESEKSKLSQLLNERDHLLSEKQRELNELREEYQILRSKVEELELMLTSEVEESQKLMSKAFRERNQNKEKNFSTKAQNRSHSSKVPIVTKEVRSIFSILLQLYYNEVHAFAYFCLTCINRKSRIQLNNQMKMNVLVSLLTIIPICCPKRDNKLKLKHPSVMLTEQCRTRPISW